jgi:hypothetical protein
MYLLWFSYPRVNHILQHSCTHKFREDVWKLGANLWVGGACETHAPHVRYQTRGAIDKNIDQQITNKIHPEFHLVGYVAV